MERPTLTSHHACYPLCRPLLESVAEVMDDEAEMLVVRLWRFLIYETEVRKQGLA